MNEVSLADIAAVTDRNGYGNNGMWGDGGFFWIFALLLLPGMFNGGIWGNNGRGEVVTESALCNSMNFNNLENAVGRISDQVNGVNTNLGNAVCNLGYETLRNFNNLEAQLASCCCNMEKLLLENRYLAAQNTADINATTTAKAQAVLDAICGLRMEMKDNQNAQLMQRVNQLEMQQLMCGVVRYPLQTTYSTDCNPFFGGNRCGNCYGNGNI